MIMNQILYKPTIKNCTIAVVGFSKQHQNSKANLTLAD